MPTLEIAHLREQGVDIIIAPLDSSFGNKSQADQGAARAQIQRAAASAGLRGAVTVVWEGSDGRMRFISPTNQRAFFQSIHMGFVMANLNRTLSW